MKLSKPLVTKILKNIDAGLVSGMGIPEPGKMCVEAAICYSLGLPHGDDPQCVSQAVRSLKIALNDRRWPSNAARAAGMRRLAIAQLGTNENFDEVEFAIRCALLVCKDKTFAEWANAWLDGSDRSREAAAEAAWASPWAAYAAAEAAGAAAGGAARAARAARAAADAARAARAAVARASGLAKFAEQVVQILIEMKVPAVKYLPPL